MAADPKATPPVAKPVTKAPAKTLEVSTVLINRGHTTTIPVTVFSYEVPVLEEIHGEQSVTVVDTHLVPMPEDFGAADAYAQMNRRYSQKDGETAIRHVYRRVSDLARESGLPYTKGDEDRIKFDQASVIIHKPDAPATGSGDGAGEDE